MYHRGRGWLFVVEITRLDKEQMMSGIAAVARVPEHLDVFWVAGDGRVTSSWWHDQLPWSGAFGIGGFFPAGAPISAVSRRSDQLDLFVVGNDGRVYTSWWHEGQPWSGAADNWMSIGGFFPPGASVTAVSRNADQLDVFVIGNDGRVWTSWWNPANGWSGGADNWMSVGGVFPTTATITAVSRNPEQLDLFITGNDGRVYTSWWNPANGWSGGADNWMSVGGFFPVGAPVAAVSRNPEQLDLFITGNDGRVYTSWWNPANGWSGGADNWMSIGGFFPVGAPVTAVSRLPEQLDLFITGNDGRVYTSWWNPANGWSGGADNWMSIGGFFPPGERIAAVSRFAEHLDLFLRGNDGLVYSSWWDGATGWSGAQDNWFPITVPPGPRLDFQQLIVEQAQEDGLLSDGDEPYVVTLGFRSTFRTPGTTSVFWGGDLHELGDLDAGDSAGIPPSMGHVAFPGVAIRSQADLLQGRFPELFGAMVLVMESDATPFGAVGDLIRTIQGALSAELTRLVEGGQLISNFAAPPDQIRTEVNENLQKAVDHVMSALDVSAGEAISLWLQSLSDPDDYIGYHAFVFAGVDASLASLLPAMSGGARTVGPFAPGPIDVRAEGDDARYRITGVISG